MEKVKIDGKEYGKIPFDLERWQSGDFVKVVTRDNIDAEQLILNKYENSTYRICAIVEEDFEVFTLDGFYEYPKSISSYDLHLIIELPQPKEYWQNVYVHEDKPTINFMGNEHPSQNAADRKVDDASVRIGYFKTTIVEGEKPKYEFIPINQ